MKRNINWIIKKRITILQISLLVICVIVPTVLLVPAGKPKIIASLVSLSLNGETKEDIQAQILIENSTTHEMEENSELISLIESDMIILSDLVQGLEKISSYNYSYSPLPGRIDFLLENIHFREKNYLREINSIVESDSEMWWYVEEFSFTPIQEEVSIVDSVDFTYCGEFARFNLRSYKTPQSHIDNVTLQRNETLIASYWIVEDGNWTSNEDFVNVIDNEIFSLRDIIVGIEEISNPYQDNIDTDFNETWINQKYPIVYNLTEPVPYDYAKFLGDISLRIEFSKGTSRTERNAALKVFMRIVLSKWYVQDFYVYGPCDFGEDMIRFFIGMATLFFACVVIIPVTTYRLVKKAKRRKKDLTHS